MVSHVAFCKRFINRVNLSVINFIHILLSILVPKRVVIGCLTYGLISNLLAFTFDTINMPLTIVLHILDTSLRVYCIVCFETGGITLITNLALVLLGTAFNMSH